MSLSAPVFVTGGTGLVGSYVLRYLLHTGHTAVRALRRPGSSLRLIADAADRINWIEGDLSDFDALERGTAGARSVYHCAASIDHSPKGRAAMRRVNVVGTAELVNAALYNQVSDFCYVSSIAAIGRRPKLRQIDERTEWKDDAWNSAYGAAKRDGELEVRRGEAEGLRVLIVNPSLVMGPGQWDRGMPRWFTNIDKGLRFYPPGGGGFVDVRDVAAFMVRGMKAELFGERYILNAVNLPYREVMNFIAELLERPQPRTAVTPLIKEMAWRWEGLRAAVSSHQPLVTRETADNSMRTFYYQGRAATEALDFTYRDWQASLRDMVHCYRAPTDRACFLPF